MSQINLLATRVREQLTAVAEEIISSVERNRLESNREVVSVSEEDGDHSQDAGQQRQETTRQTPGPEVCEVRLQRAVVTEQLSAAAEEILLLVERAMVQFEEEAVRSKQEIERQNKLLDIILRPQVKLHRADILRDKLSVCDAETLPEPDQSPRVTPEDPEPPHPRWAARVKERLTAAAEKIVGFEERTTLEFMEDIPSPSKEVNRNPQSDVERRLAMMPQTRGTEACEVRLQRAVVTEQLSAAAEEILLLVERAMVQFEEEAVRSKQEIERQNKLLDIILRPQVKLHRADTLWDKGSVCDKNKNLPRLEWSREGPDSPQGGEHVQPLSSSPGCSDGEEKNSEDWYSDEREDSGSDDDRRGERRSRLKKAEKPRMKGSTPSDETTKPSTLKCSKSRAKVVSTPFCCKVCGQRFCYEVTLWKHVQKHNTGTDVCGVCGRRFESKDSLKLHLNAYIRTNVCSVCGKEFGSHREMVIHVRTHTREKPYVCTYCDKGFSRMDSLKDHMRIHTGKPFCCSECGEMFTRNTGLKTHMKVHSGERPYVCTICGKAFTLSRNLVVHMRIHTGEKPYACSLCDKSFSQSSTLKMHTRIHTGERTHICGFCGKGFYQGGALKVHLRTHTGEKPYLCNEDSCEVHTHKRVHCCTVCGKAFTRRDHLKRHAKIHTGDA